jgi:uncharacterized membrane protein
MPNNSEKQDSEKPDSTDNVTEQPQPVAPASDSPKVGYSNRRKLVLGLIVLSVFVLGLLATAGFAVYNGMHQRFADGDDQGFSRGMHMRSGSGFSRQGQTVQTDVSNGAVTTTVYNYVTGVVTAINSDNIVIAGNGKQTTIKTNSSTSYVGNTKPAVNDTVSIAGTTADNVITATQISVANR